MAIRFHTFTGYNFLMRVAPSDKIYRLKKRLCTARGSPVEGLPSNGLRLNFEGKLLDNHHSIAQSGIEEGSCIELRWINTK